MASNPPAQTAFTPGYSVGASDMLAITGGIGWLTGNPPTGYSRRPVFHLAQTVAQSISNNSSPDTAVLLDTEVYDTDNGHSTTSNTSRYTVQTSGVYLLFGVVVYAANSTGGRNAKFRVNGSTNYWGQQVTVSGTLPSAFNCSGLIPLNAGDYVELATWQNSGGALNTDVTNFVVGGSRLAGLMVSTL